MDGRSGRNWSNGLRSRAGDPDPFHREKVFFNSDISRLNESELEEIIASRWMENNWKGYREKDATKSFRIAPFSRRRSRWREFSRIVYTIRTICGEIRRAIWNLSRIRRLDWRKSAGRMPGGTSGTVQSDGREVARAWDRDRLVERRRSCLEGKQSLAR